jgi:predicted RNA-binding Zn-ribbon protein involved in translation (DUF1610 family)
MATNGNYQQAIDKKLPDLKCPLCGEKDVSVLERCFTSVEFDLAENRILSATGMALPMVIAACTNCGHSLHFVREYLLG